MHKCSSNINPKCDHCGNIEDSVRLFTKCPTIKKIWTQYQPILTKQTGKDYNPQQHLQNNKYIINNVSLSRTNHQKLPLNG